MQCDIETLFLDFSFSFSGGSSLCCQSLLWCEGSASPLGNNATYSRGKNSASEDCVHPTPYKGGRGFGRGWGLGLRFWLNPPRWPKKAGKFDQTGNQQAHDQPTCPRQANLTEQLTGALAVRLDCGCDRLDCNKDPNVKLQQFKDYLRVTKKYCWSDELMTQKHFFRKLVPWHQSAIIRRLSWLIKSTARVKNTAHQSKNLQKIKENQEIYVSEHGDREWERRNTWCSPS